MKSRHFLNDTITSDFLFGFLVTTESFLEGVLILLYTKQNSQLDNQTRKYL